MSQYDKMATAAMLHDHIQNPPTHNTTRAAHYDVSPGASPTFIPFSGTTSRLAVKFDTAGTGIGTIPYKVNIPYRRVGNPSGNLKVGIRKAAGDTFTLIAEHPIVTMAQPFIVTGSSHTVNVLYNITVEGINEYQMVANDKISIEYPPNATDTIEVACGTGLPAGFTSQQYTGSYAATAAPLAVKITSRVLTAI